MMFLALLCSSFDFEPRTQRCARLYSNIDAAQKVGELIAKKAQEKGISKVVFDRGGNLFHGRVKALAEGAREAGLEF